MEKAERKLTLSYLTRARYEESLDLRKLYPISPFFVVQSFLLWASAAVALALVFGTNNAVSKMIGRYDPVEVILESRIGTHAYSVLGFFGHSISMFAYTVATLGLIVALLFLYLYRLSYDYRVDSGVLYLAKGVLLRDKQNIVLADVSDVFLQRGMFDHPFGLAEVVLCMPGIFGERTVRIKGLSMSDAFALEECLSGLIGGRRTEERMRFAAN